MVKYARPWHLIPAALIVCLWVASAFAVGGIVGSPISGGTSTTLSTGAVTTTEILDETIAGGDLNPAINIATTGTIGGAVTILDNVAGPTGAQLYGTWNVVNANITVDLVAGVQGMSICVQDTGTAHDLIVDVPGTDNVILVGVEGAAGVGITNAAGTSTGDIVCLIALATNKWTVTYKVGTWASQ